MLKSPPMRPPYRINRDPVAGDAPPFPAPRELDSGDESFLVPLADSHFDQLFAASHGDARRESVWDFLPYGPFASPAQMRACYRALPQNGDPQFYAVMRRDSKSPIEPIPTGVMSYLRIQPAARSIEIGHIWHAVARQKTRANTIGNGRRVCVRQSPRRMEMRRRQRALARRGFAFGIRFRRRLPPLHGDKKSKPRHSLVCAHRFRLAASARQYRGVAGGKIAVADGRTVADGSQSPACRMVARRARKLAAPARLSG